MVEQRWFYRGIEEWQAFVERLKLIPCPHCQVVGALIRHGFLSGFDDATRAANPSAHAASCAATAMPDQAAVAPSASGPPTKSDASP